MNKPGHLMITEAVSGKISGKYRLWLKIGSILPDILLTTYLTGHTWTAAHSKIRIRMKHLEQHGTMTRFSFLALGYILHYIEDYFTYPHNVWFNSDLSAHIIYERNFTEYIYSQKESVKFIDPGCTMSFEALLDSLCHAHQNYAKETPGFANDLRYIQTAVSNVLYSYLLIFERNQQHADSKELDKSELIIFSHIR